MYIFRVRLPVLLSLLVVVGLLNAHVTAKTLTGKITDAETRLGIRDVNVRIMETDQIVATDQKGEFEIPGLDAGTYHLLASHVVYQTSELLTVTIPADTSLHLSLAPAPWVLNDVVVTATRSPHLLKEVPVQTEVVGQREFQRTGATTVDEALTSAIGITINEDLSGQGAAIRGIEADRVLVLVDGERAVGRVRGSIDLSQYALTNVQKIEIVKGTGSTLYGSDAMGGVINIITRRPATEKMKADAYIDYGSHRQFNPTIELRYGKKDFGVDLGGKLFSTSGFDLDKSTPHTNGQEDIRRWNLNGKLRANLSEKWSFVGSARTMHEERQWIESEVVRLSETRDTTYAYDDDEINRRYEGSAALEYLSGDKYSMKLRLFGTAYDHQWNKYSGRFWIDTSETEDRYYEASYTANYVIGRHHVATYGLDYYYQDLVSTDLASDQQADKSLAGYFQYEYSPIKQLKILPGIRYEHHSSFGEHLNPSINVMYQPDEQLKLRAFLGRGFRAPSIKQQYFVFDHTAAGYIVYGGSVALPADLDVANSGFAELQQENSINSSVSAEFSYGIIGLHRLTYFYNQLEDLIDFTLIGFTPTYWRGVYVYQNIETAITQGIEWESRVNLTKGIDLQFSYNYLYSRNLGTQEKLINRPDHTAKLFLSTFWENYGIGATLWGDYQSEKLWVPRSNTGGNEGAAENAPSRTRLNLNLFKHFGANMEAFVRMENLLDATNVDYGYWPGFELFAGFKYSISLTP